MCMCCMSRGGWGSSVPADVVDGDRCCGAGEDCAATGAAATMIINATAPVARARAKGLRYIDLYSPWRTKQKCVGSEERRSDPQRDRRLDARWNEQVA